MQLPPWPYYDDETVEAVERVLRSGKVNYWTGEEARAFEREFAELVGARHAIALANGTVALELALYALGIGPGDEVITSPRTFIASASCAVMRGARPFLADVDRDSQTITADTIAPRITPRTKAIIPVHLAGWPCEMDPILDLARAHGLHVIEDCAQSHGALYRGRHTGTMGMIGAYSFCQDKIMTTGGEGGMVVTDDADLWDRMWSFKDHGKSFDAVYNRDWPPGFRWLHESFGTNWRLTEMQAAIGRVQIRRLPEWVERRRANASILNDRLGGLPALRVPLPPDHIRHSYYKHYAFVRPEALKSGWDRDRIMNAVEARGVPCFSGSCSEIYLEKAFPEEWRPAERLPVAKELGETSLMFLVHPTLEAEHIHRFADVVVEVMEEATS